MRNVRYNSSLKHSSKQGFTIVELLIVVVVIAILAAITIIAYNGITKRANDSSIQSTLSQAAQKIEMYKTNNDGTLYPSTLTAAGLDNLTNTGGRTYAYSISSDSTQFCLALSQSGRTYYASNISLSPKTGICTAGVGVQGTGDVATDGSSSPTAQPTYSIFDGQVPFSPKMYGDGGGSLKIGNRFYTTENSGIKVTGLRVYNPTVYDASSSPSAALSPSITAWAYTHDWLGATINGGTTFAQSPVATKTYSGTRTAGTWTDIMFDSPITLAKINSAAGPADLITIAIQYAGGNNYVFATGLPGPDTLDSRQSTARPGTYLAEHWALGRGVITLNSGEVNSYYGIDIIYVPVTP